MALTVGSAASAASFYAFDGYQEQTREFSSMNLCLAALDEVDQEFLDKGFSHSFRYYFTGGGYKQAYVQGGVGITGFAECKQ